MDTFEIFMRMGLATGAGLLLGLDRELRGIAAGLRTHAMISMSSAMITISALMIYFQFDVDGSNIDPLRVIQGLAQAVGFVAAGAVFVAGNKVHNLTSATTIWLAAAVGIGAGAGQYMLVAAGMAFGIVIVTLVRIVERLLIKRYGDEDAG
jgi:putative Mg2+ transporter-C (MgtC) family protein